MMQLFIGIVSGGMGALLGLVLLGASTSLATFLVGMVLGFVLSNVLFQVVASAVDTVVVCFAEAPTQLQQNHRHEISQRMIQAWRTAYPSECGF
jgi:hypothetical protein